MSKTERSTKRSASKVRATVAQSQPGQEAPADRPAEQLSETQASKYLLAPEVVARLALECVGVEIDSDDDPLLSLLDSLHDDMATVALALDSGVTLAYMSRLIDRYMSTVHLARELHLRDVEAAR
jgi:hypothetical protein